MSDITPKDLREAGENIDQSAVGCAAVTLGAALPRPCREIYVGSGGSLNLTFADGSSAEHVGLLTGISYPWSCTLISAGTTGTSAASIVAHF